MLYDLTTLQREANTRYGFSAQRTLARRPAALRGAQGAHLSAHQLALPDDRHGRGDQADRRAGRERTPSTARAREYVAGLDVLPLARVVNDEKVTDHHAIIPTRSEHNRREDGRRRQAHLRHGRAALPGGLPPRGRVREHARGDDRRGASRAPPSERPAAAHVFRTRGKLLLVPGWRGVYGEVAAEAKAADARATGTRTRTTDQQLPRLREDEPVQTREIESARKETKPPRRYSDASLLGAMETAGKLVEDDELREAMKDSGIGTPATRAAIIERLITVGYVERDGRALVATEKGLNVIRLLDEHALTSPGLTGELGAPAGHDRARRGLARGLHEATSPASPQETVHEARREAQGRAHPAGPAGAMPGLRPRDRRRTARATRAGRARIRAAAS